MTSHIQIVIKTVGNAIFPLGICQPRVTRPHRLFCLLTQGGLICCWSSALGCRKRNLVFCWFLCSFVSFDLMCPILRLLWSKRNPIRTLWFSLLLLPLCMIFHVINSIVANLPPFTANTGEGN